MPAEGTAPSSTMVIHTLWTVAEEEVFLYPLQQHSVNSTKCEITVPVFFTEAHGVQLVSLAHATAAKLGTILLPLSL